MSGLSESLGKGFTVTTEVKPPRGPDTTGFEGEIGMLKSLKGLTAVNLVDSPSARLFMSSLGASIMLKQAGLEPIFQMVCRDRNILALESDLISASAFGIENILALTGDHPSRGASDHPDAKPVYDLDSTSLIRTISLMNEGRDITGKELKGSTEFYVGGAISPGVNPVEPEVLKVKRKMEAGARFFQTQVVFDLGVVEDFMEKADEMVGDIRGRVLVGIIPLASERMIDFLNRLPGILVPEDVASRVVKADDPVAEGVSVALELIDGVRSAGMAGAHIMPVGRLNSLERILADI
ncbi:MAG: 5,10-methylenetetrahydrofolate reductase [Candidatus Altiarchaeales archaeon]|nr:5,10-methylenetetrahydrofolate reductase [Candidatus Altiarchaeales archaeon]MBD3415817.1 5,10-methylenetetrahydrofolate reductase [Candidatus Altiarchaeales archaeon]